MKRFSAAATCIAAAFVLSSGQVRAACPAFPGTWWAFQTTDGVEDSAVGVFSMGAAGRFGLNITTQTSDLTGHILAQANFTGQYSVDGNTGAFCTGELVFNQGGNNYMFEFVLVNNGTEMLLTNNSSEAPGNAGNNSFTPNTHGTAKLLPGAPVCPANPLSLLIGTNWGFLTENFEQSFLGTFSATAGPVGGRAVNPLVGALNATITVSTVSGGPVFNYGQTAGSFMVDSNSNCAGGQIIFNTSGQGFEGEQSYAFVFSAFNAGVPTELFLVANNNEGNGPNNNIFGQFATHGSAHVAP